MTGSMDQWFSGHGTFVSLLYGTTLLVMGTAILVYPRRDSGYPIGRIMWLLAAYALLRAPNDFIDIWAHSRDIDRHLHLPGQLLTYASFIFLFEFGRRLIGLTTKGFPVWVLPALLVCTGAAGARAVDFWNGIEALSGWLIRFPAGVLCGLGMILYYRSMKETLDRSECRSCFSVGGAAMIAWAFFGVLRAKGEFFPASLLNEESFFIATGLPVQLFRMACAIITTVSVLRILRMFDFEKKRRLQGALDLQERLTEAIDEGILLIDRDFTILWANRKQIDTYGDIVGDRCYHATHGKDTPCGPPDDTCPAREVLETGKPSSATHVHVDASGSRSTVEVACYPIRDERGEIVQFVHLTRDVTVRMRAQEEREKLIDQLQKALDDVKVLRGMLPICASCKKIRDDGGYWTQLEAYISEHSEAVFSHGMCPACMRKMYPEYFEQNSESQA